MPIPWDRCRWEPAELAEVEADLAAREMPDLWLGQWRALLDKRMSGDDLRYYSARTEHPAAPEPAAEPIAGFEQVRDGEALVRVGLAGAASGDVDHRWGLALVRDDAILDWVEMDAQG